MDTENEELQKHFRNCSPYFPVNHSCANSSKHACNSTPLAKKCIPSLTMNLLFISKPLQLYVTTVIVEYRKTEACKIDHGGCFF